jgi:hypothetical protein
MNSQFNGAMMYRWFVAAFLLVLLLLTNRYLSVRDSDVLSIDSYNYLRIATAFPRLPAPNSVLSAHHVQRFVLPYLAGGFSKVTGLSMNISFRVFAIAGILLIVGLLVTVLAKISQLSPFHSLWLVALQILNPYSFRIYIANPFLLNDIFFQVGSLILVLGLLEESVSLSLLGICVAVCSRQTALLLLPPMLVWLTILWPKTKRRGAILTGVTGTLIVLLIYEITSRVAVHIAGTTVSIETVTGLLVWLRGSPNLRVIAEFGLRGLIGLALPIAILLATLPWHKGIAQWSREDRLRTGLLLGFAAMVASQPILGGPAVTGRDITRLVLLALPPLLIAVGIVFSYTTLGTEFWRQAFPLFIAISAAASFHHTYSFLGIGTGSERTNRFALVHFACGILLFLWLETLILSRSHSPANQDKRT